jgi:hypothetical protein
MQSEYFLCIIKTEFNDIFYHLYDKKYSRYYVGSHFIGSFHHDCSYEDFNQKKIDMLIPINKITFDRLMKTHYIELTSFSLRHNLKQLKLEEYLV